MIAINHGMEMPDVQPVREDLVLRVRMLRDHSLMERFRLPWLVREGGGVIGADIGASIQILHQRIDVVLFQSDQ